MEEFTQICARKKYKLQSPSKAIQINHISFVHLFIHNINLCFGLLLCVGFNVEISLKVELDGLPIGYRDDPDAVDVLGVVGGVVGGHDVAWWI